MSDTTGDVVVNMGDPSAHVHAFRTFGADEAGAHDLICDCGQEASGYGEFEPATEEQIAARQSKLAAAAPQAEDDAPEQGA